MPPKKLASVIGETIGDVFFDDESSAPTVTMGESKYEGGVRTYQDRANDAYKKATMRYGLTNTSGEQQLIEALFGMEESGRDRPFRGKKLKNPVFKKTSPEGDINEQFILNPTYGASGWLQDDLDIAYTDALAKGRMRRNPDTGELQLAGNESVLGTVYFDKGGEFEDYWNIGLDPGERVFSAPDGTFDFDRSKLYRTLVDPFTSPPTITGRANVNRQYLFQDTQLAHPTDKVLLPDEWISADDPGSDWTNLARQKGLKWQMTDDEIIETLSSHFMDDPSETVFLGSESYWEDDKDALEFWNTPLPRISDTERALRDIGIEATFADVDSDKTSVKPLSSSRLRDFKDILFDE